MEVTSEQASLLKEIITWLQTSDRGLLIVIMFTLTWLLKDFIKKLPYEILNILSLIICNKTKPACKKFTSNDIKHHPIFASIDFWLNNGIDSINYNTPIILINIQAKHTESRDYIQAKEEMAKEVLRIKISTIKEMLTSLISQHDWNQLAAVQMQGIFERAIEETRTKQMQLLVESGIPHIFIFKFNAIDEANRMFFDKILKHKLQEEILCNIDGNTRAFIAINVIYAYLTAMFNTIYNTILGINGDLVGEIWRGKPIQSPNEDSQISNIAQITLQARTSESKVKK